MTSGPRQKSTLNFVLRASIFHSPFFFWTLALAQVACISLSAPSLHHVQLLPLPFWFCGWVPEGLGVGVEGDPNLGLPQPQWRVPGQFGRQNEAMGDHTDGSQSLPKKLTLFL